MKNCDIPIPILEYIELVESNKPRACKEQHALVRHIRKCFKDEKLFFDEELYNNYLKLVKYFPYDQLFAWEKFLIALWDCTFYENQRKPRWKSVFAMVGRGAGKDGFIAFDAMCSVSPYNKIAHYDVDVCANNEEQAKRPLKDFIEVLEVPSNESKLNKFFYHTKEIVQGRKYKGEVKGHTNNPKGRDGLRSGKVIFNEVHQYENYENIKVFTTGLGKKAEPRIGYFTSNGHISDGVIDDYLKRSERILFEGEDDKGFLPFICRLENKKQVHDKLNWHMANPSLAYLPNLMHEIEDEFSEWVERPEQHGDFITKRFGIRETDRAIAVTEYEKVIATNKPLIELQKYTCSAGIDYAELSDWASVNLHFKVGDYRYDINHAWVCLESKTLHRIKPPWRDWEKAGHLTGVDDVSIHPDLIANYLWEMMKKYNIKMLGIDGFRYTLLSESLKKIGFNANERKNVKLVRPTDVMKVEPIIQECFNRELFYWADNPCLRWAVQNTKRVKAGARIKSSVDTGNFVYSKIEPKARKTDMWMALVHSMVCEEQDSTERVSIPSIGAITI